MTTPLAVSPNGTQILEYIKTDFPAPPEDQRDIPLIFTMVALTYEGKFVFVHNRTRCQWENPGGAIEHGETPEACAIREVWEESSQHITNPQYQGLIKIKLGDRDRTEFGAVFTAELETLSPFLVNNEMDGFILWDFQQDIGTVSVISKKTVELACGL